jgi:hypothetical protein
MQQSSEPVLVGPGQRLGSLQRGGKDGVAVGHAPDPSQPANNRAQVGDTDR